MLPSRAGSWAGRILQPISHQLIDDGGVGECHHVPHVGPTAGQDLEDPAHYLAAACLGQRVGELYHVGLGYRAYLLTNMCHQLFLVGGGGVPPAPCRRGGRTTRGVRGAPGAAALSAR